MAKKDDSKKSKKTKPKTAPERVDIHVDGNVEKGNIIVGDNNVVNNYYQVVEKNTKPNDPDFWNLEHPYPMPPNFTGRLEERAMLTQWLDGDSENRLFILRALGGFGKSALAWQWLTHDVNPETWKKVVFWSFYEGDASFEHFVEETLKYLNREVPQGKRDQVDALLKAMQADNILLIMDGFERALRAYGSMNAAYQGDEEQKLDGNHLDCVDVNAEWFLKSVCALPKLKSKVLMTTRLTPRAVMAGATRESPLQGCREMELTAMSKADAVEFFHKQGVQGNRVEIESACEPYGYHPLSLRLLAGRILKDFENPSDISVAQKLKIDGDIIQQKHHVLEVSYNSLPEYEQKLLSTIACFRSPVELKTLEEINVGTRYIVSLQDQLHDLIDRGLLHFDAKSKKFDLHPIVRRFAYDHLTAADRTGAHERLVNYFEAVPKPEKVEKLEDLAPVIELYHHMVRAGKYTEAEVLYYERLRQILYFQFGAYQIIFELLRSLFINGENEIPPLDTDDKKTFALNELANSYSLSGQPRRAVPLFEMANDIFENKMKNKQSLAIGLGNVADDQLKIGALSEAERNLRRSVDLCREIEETYKRIPGLWDLGRTLAYLGRFEESEKELNSAFDLSIQEKAIQSECVVWSYRALRFLLMAREEAIFDIRKSDNEYRIPALSNVEASAIQSAQRALELAEERHKSIGRPNVRDYIRAHWLLGAAYRANNELDKAEENLTKALNLCRQINMVDHEADILLDVARLRYAQGDFKDGQEKVSEALMITERSGYVLQGADVNLFLAELALTPSFGHPSPAGRGAGEREKEEIARKYAEEAKRLATGWEEIDGKVVYDTTGKYVYKVAYDEAVAMLERLKV